MNTPAIHEDIVFSAFRAVSKHSFDQPDVPQSDIDAMLTRQLAADIAEHVIRMNADAVEKTDNRNIAVHSLSLYIATPEVFKKIVLDAARELVTRDAIPPEPKTLRCPYCRALHIDEGEWATKPHRTHQCGTCSTKWRPFNYPTVGV